MRQPSIRDLGIIGDKKSCAFIDKQGTIAWYCPWRFDQPSMFSLLVDDAGGYCSITADTKTFSGRQYDKESAVLISQYSIAGKQFIVTDFMPMNASVHGICRIISPSPVPLQITIVCTPNYNRSICKLQSSPNKYTVSCPAYYFYCSSSHPLTVNGNTITIDIPANESAWLMMADEQKNITGNHIAEYLQQTKAHWRKLLGNIQYDGPYQKPFLQSYLAIQLMTHQFSGGILAAGTTSLPEVIGGRRNYDYRFVWLRDTAMVVSALVRAETTGDEATRFLDFLCRARNTNKQNLFVPFYDLDAKTADQEEFLPGTGYRGSVPVRFGNGAFEQLQLDGQGNVLLAAKLIYSKHTEKPHWKTIVKTADHLVKSWHQKDHGIWEEHTLQHFTSSKVIVATSLQFIAAATDDKKQQELWLSTAAEIKEFINKHCMTSDGAYAVYAGSQDVDVTAALYPVWLFDDVDSPAMKQTIRRIETEYIDGELYHRRLELSNSKQEGVFLAASLWMAQYYVMCGQLTKAKTIIDAALQFANDLYFFAEEGDIASGEMLGNFPQTFVHASFMGVILDYKKALKKAQPES